jgi:PAS domain S-box-containing protein
MLRGFTRRFGSFDDAQFGELEIEKRLSGNCNLAFAECWYWIRKLQARVLAGDCAAAVEASAQAQRLLWTSLSTLEMAEYHFYSALARAQSCDSVSADERQPHVDALSAHHGLIKVWADRCPENFENRAALVGAEIARLERRDVDAMRLYQQAVHSARAHGFVQNEALAYELAARFYAGAGFREIADLHLRNSRRCYLRWGADGKVRQLDALYPQLREDEPIAGPTETIGAPVEHLDLGTVIKVSQVVSSEIVLEKLIDTLLRTAIEQAGAERGLLLLLRGDALRIEAEAATGGDMVTVQLRDEPTAGTALPQSVLQYVLRTRETVILDDATAHPPFAADPYIRERQARSILCLPMINQTRLTGVLYLENSLAPGVFAPARLAVLKLLASQAAIALENTRLYRDLAEREAKIRRLVDANIIGIFIWQLDGRIIDANDAFLGIVGYDRDDLDSGRIRWTDLTPPEWRAVTDRALTEVRATGNGSAYEKEYFRKDGSRVPVLIGATAFEGGRDEGVNFILDLTERKRAEAEARESERRYREMEMELAHANRVATMGQLTASIAHELNQPIAAASTNADAALRWLGAKPPDLEEVRQALTRIVRDADRAGAVIGRVRDLIKKAPQRKDSVDMSEAVREVIALASSEIARGGVALQMEFGDGLPRIAGDRVQLQQVVLNLVVNAVQAMAEMEDGGRQLLVSTGQAEPAGVLVTVTDSGPGLPPERVDRVFDPFYTTKPGGLGMGLSICRSIIEAHGGRLWVAGDLPRGASFHFSLPARPSQAP